MYVCIYKVPFRDVGGMKSGGCRELKRETHVKSLHLFFESKESRSELSHGLLIYCKERSVVSSLVIDALACLGEHLVGDMDYCIARRKA